MASVVRVAADILGERRRRGVRVSGDSHDGNPAAAGSSVPGGAGPTAEVFTPAGGFHGPNPSPLDFTGSCLTRQELGTGFTSKTFDADGRAVTGTESLESEVLEKW
eukprot:CAMPEP_0177782186 /NCGR_PEP_ID=MMETSP0491_2-20121128/18303_1 /TAXON_ID=63592 /ORGANISM="Tetraselmis chuii, Strain PLY429" /LENGTH=105 /DNA_ID=CAMNT_0019302409 /DNA_START=808 /DNA_END=1122 /DNA_ORIENTATION=+